MLGKSSNMIHGTWVLKDGTSGELVKSCPLKSLVNIGKGTQVTIFAADSISGMYAVDRE